MCGSVRAAASRFTKVSDNSLGVALTSPAPQFGYFAGVFAERITERTRGRDEARELREKVKVRQQAAEGTSDGK
jgi:hypothetical protein